MSNSNQDWPQTVEEAVERLLVIVEQDTQQHIRQLAEKDLIQLHLPFGMQVRNVFGLWGGNPALRKACGSENLHPDEASGIIIRAFWKRLNQRPDWNQNNLHWTATSFQAQTLEEALDWLLAVMPEDTRYFIKATSRTNLPTLEFFYAKDLERVFGLAQGNDALVRDCQTLSGNGANPGRVILTALWDRLNQL